MLIVTSKLLYQFVFISIALQQYTSTAVTVCNVSKISKLIIRNISSHGSDSGSHPESKQLFGMPTIMPSGSKRRVLNSHTDTHISSLLHVEKHGSLNAVKYRY